MHQITRVRNPRGEVCGRGIAERNFSALVSPSSCGQHEPLSVSLDTLSDTKLQTWHVIGTLPPLWGWESPSESTKFSLFIQVGFMSQSSSVSWQDASCFPFFTGSGTLRSVFKPSWAHKEHRIYWNDNLKEEDERDWGTRETYDKLNKELRV